jgi:hypothetical protein
MAEPYRDDADHRPLTALEIERFCVGDGIP